MPAGFSTSTIAVSTGQMPVKSLAGHTRFLAPRHRVVEVRANAPAIRELSETLS